MNFTCLPRVSTCGHMSAHVGKQLPHVEIMGTCFPCAKHVEHEQTFHMKFMCFFCKDRPPQIFSANNVKSGSKTCIAHNPFTELLDDPFSQYLGQNSLSGLSSWQLNTWRAWRVLKLKMSDCLFDLLMGYVWESSPAMGERWHRVLLSLKLELQQLNKRKPSVSLFNLYGQFTHKDTDWCKSMWMHAVWPRCDIIMVWLCEQRKQLASRSGTG